MDISGYGLLIRVIASLTFPTGFTITQFADDADPFDLPSIQIADKAMGLNGDLLTWSKATPTDITVAVAPNSESDKNLAVLFNINRVGRGKISVIDEITMTGIYPDGSSIVAVNGRMINGLPGNSVANAGRLKSKPYIFTFERLDFTGAS